MSAYGDIVCIWCGVSYDERAEHTCDMEDIRDRIEDLEAENIRLGRLVGEVAKRQLKGNEV